MADVLAAGILIMLTVLGGGSYVAVRSVTRKRHRERAMASALQLCGEGHYNLLSDEERALAVRYYRQQFVEGLDDSAMEQLERLQETE
jgi:hypothetical protein